jgi:hypothetical protein
MLDRLRWSETSCTPYIENPIATHFYVIVHMHNYLYIPHTSRNTTYLVDMT